MKNANQDNPGLRLGFCLRLKLEYSLKKQKNLNKYYCKGEKYFCQVNKYKCNHDKYFFGSDKCFCNHDKYFFIVNKYFFHHDKYICNDNKCFIGVKNIIIAKKNKKILDYYVRDRSNYWLTDFG